MLQFFVFVTLQCIYVYTYMHNEDFTFFFVESKKIKSVITEDSFINNFNMKKIFIIWLYYACMFTEIHTSVTPKGSIALNNSYNTWKKVTSHASRDKIWLYMLQQTTCNPNSEKKFSNNYCTCRYAKKEYFFSTINTNHLTKRSKEQYKKIELQNKVKK